MGHFDGVMLGTTTVFGNHVISIRISSPLPPLGPIQFEGIVELPTPGLLVIIPCGQGKVWDRDSLHGPTAAEDAYTGSPFKVNKQYAERFAERWVILSALYGFIPPDFSIPGPYNVTFKRKSTNPVTVDTLKIQIQEQHLDQFTKIVGLGGKEYRAVIEVAFTPFGKVIEFPFAGLPIGRAMAAIKRAIESCPQADGVQSGENLERATMMMLSRQSVLKAIEEFDKLGRHQFLDRYGFGPARSYFLVHNGKLYDSKAIVGAAYGYEHPNAGALQSGAFCGGWATVRRWLEALGFEVRIVKERAQATVGDNPDE